VRGDGRIIGFAPLMIRRRFAGLKQLQFVGSGNADYQDFVLPVGIRALKDGKRVRFFKSNGEVIDA
jgi:CelD/BcsL family acetyltransferase involved in cellulose biosynthesis